MKLKAILLFAILSGSLAQAQTENSSLTYHVELEATAGNGTYGEPDHGAAGRAEQSVVRSNCGKSVNFSEIAEKHWTRAGKCGILVKTKRVRWICTRKERFL